MHGAPAARRMKYSGIKSHLRWLVICHLSPCHVYRFAAIEKAGDIREEALRALQRSCCLPARIVSSGRPWRHHRAGSRRRNRRRPRVGIMRRENRAGIIALAACAARRRLVRLGAARRPMPACALRAVTSPRIWRCDMRNSTEISGAKCGRGCYHR